MQFRVSLQGSGGPEFRVDNFGDAYLAGLLFENSDRNAKTNVRPIDRQAILEEVAALPIARWACEATRGTNHIGPMAQDFRAPFGTGANDTTLATMFNKICKLAFIPLALGSFAMTGCATRPSQTSTGTHQDSSGWSYVGSDSSGGSYFIDYGTIRRNGDYAKVAQKHVWKTPEIFCNGNSPARSGRFVGEYNCRTDQTRSLFSAAYSGPDLDGQVVFGSDASTPWRRVLPGTVGASILKAVCN